MNVDEQRIRDFAYQIWESEGQPDGQQQRHWEMALKLVEAADSAAELQPGKPARKVKKEEVSIREAPAPRKKGVKEKSAQPRASEKSAGLQSIGKSAK